MDQRLRVMCMVYMVLAARRVCKCQSFSCFFSFDNINVTQCLCRVFTSSQLFRIFVVIVPPAESVLVPFISELVNLADWMTSVHVRGARTVSAFSATAPPLSSMCLPAAAGVEGTGDAVVGDAEEVNADDGNGVCFLCMCSLLYYSPRPPS